MGIYIFKHPTTPETREVFFRMNDKKAYSENGIEWERVWTVPQGATDVRLDPFSTKDFLKKTGKNTGTMGELIDRSAELSKERADKNGGVDPVKKKYWDNWSKKRLNRPYPKDYLA